MLRFEMKKILCKPINKIVLLILSIAVLLGAFLTTRDVKYETAEGNTLSGGAAARLLKVEKNKWKGELTEEVLRKAIEENIAILSASATEDEAFVKQQGMSDIRELLNSVYSPPGEYDYYKMDELTPENVQGFYEKRVSALEAYINSDDQIGNFTKREKDYVIQKYQDLETPLHYEYADGWKAILQGSHFLASLMIIVVVVIGFLVAGIFSDEFTMKADSIFFSAKMGRNKAVLAKIKAGFLTMTSVYWGTVLLFSGIVLFILGFGGAGCPIQTGNDWDSIYNISYGQAWLLTLIGGYIGSLFILTLSMLVSVISRSTVLAITIPVALSCAPMFLGRISILTPVMTLFPDMLLRINENMGEFLLYSIGGKVVSVFAISIVLYLLLYFMIVPVLYQMYKRAEIK